VTYKERDQCGTKTKFISKKQARGALRHMRHKTGMHAYFCDLCHFYHVGHGDGLPRKRN